MARNIILNNLFGQPWLIDAKAAESYLPQISAFIEGSGFYSDGEFFNKKLADEKRECIEIEAAAVRNNDEEWEAFDYWLTAITPNGKRVKIHSFSQMPKDSVAVIPVKGPLMIGDQYCGPAGTATIGRMVESADSSSKISRIILEVDSPGGMVKGTKELADVVKNTSTLIDGHYTFACSAAYWIISACDNVIASSENAVCGSIGTMIEIVDAKPFFEKHGFKFHTIRATKSVDKNESYYQALEGKYDMIRTQDLDPINDNFLKSIRQNRNQLSEDTLTGKTFLAEQAIERGLADSIKPMQQFLTDLGISRNTNSNTFSMSKWKNLFGNNAEEAEKLLATKSELEAKDAELSTVKDELSTAKDELKTSKEELETAEKRIHELEGQLVDRDKILGEKDAEIKRLGGLAAEEATNVGGDKGDNMTAKDEEKYPWMKYTKKIVDAAS